jgi:hypothetical protein
MAVSSGDQITAAQFNNLQSRIEQVLGDGSGNFGYGQTVTSSQVSAVTDSITASQWQLLRADMQAAWQHQTGGTINLRNIQVGDIIGADNSGTDLLFYSSVQNIVVNSGGEGYPASVNVTVSPPQKPGGITATANAVVANGVITAINLVNAGTGYSENPTITISGSPAVSADVNAVLGPTNETIFVGVDTTGGYNDYLSLMSDIEANRFNINSGQTTTADLLSDTRTSTWNGTINMEFTVSFNDVDHRRYYFNSGGTINIESAMSSLVTSKDTDWRDMITNPGQIQFGYDYTTVTGSTVGVTLANFGNDGVTTTFQTVFEKGGNAAVDAENRYRVSVKQDSSTVLRFKVEYEDNDVGDRPSNPPPPPYGDLEDEPITANISLTIGGRRASGSVSVVFPSFSKTNTLE